METGPAGESRLMTGREVCDLLHITRSTLHLWRLQGALRGFRPRPGAHWRYRADEPVIAAALAEVNR